MKNILVPIEDHRGLASVFATARIAASQFASRIEAVPLGPDFEALIAANFAIPVSVGDEKMQRELLAQLQALYEDFRQSTAGEGTTVAWNGDALFTDIKVGAYGRVFDLIVVGRPGPDAHDPRQATLEAALFESGRPLLVAPPRPPRTIGEAVAIGWNASTETARTVSFAMPFLKRAKRVMIIAVTSAMSPGPSAEVLARALQRHGLDVSVDVVGDGAAAPGRAILARAAQFGADLLVKGGYTQSRLRQMIFGGATSQILAEAEIPVFMAH